MICRFTIQEVILMRLTRLLALCALAIIIAACSGQSPQPQLQVAPPSVPTPSSGNSVVHGQVLGKGTNAPIASTPVYMAEIHWDNDHKNAVYALDIAQSPAALTDANGFFTFSDLPPKEYALIVG